VGAGRAEPIGEVFAVTGRRTDRLQVIELRLDHCVIAVSTGDRANRFYHDVLGADLVELDKGRYAYRSARSS
jgi:hypothetical protein